MGEGTQVRFGPFRIDITDRRLWDGSQAVDLTPQAFTLLAHLVKHPGRLVTKDELMQAVWKETVVSDDALYAVMSEVRRVLRDDPQKPQFIKTEPKRGYRFTEDVQQAGLEEENHGQLSRQEGKSYNGTQPSTGILSQPPADTWQLPPGFVGRGVELQQLHRLLEKALAGERQIVFLSGEPGIGKTTLARAFLREVATTGRVGVGRGQCIEQYGTGEPYLPVLEALGRLCRSPGGEFLPRWFRQNAPTWLIQLPSFLEPADYEALQRRLQGTTRERMLRELLEAIETLTPQFPLVLLLEDLHWSDYSTLDLLSALARRSEPARLLVIGTYRSAAGLADGHPLRALLQELRSHSQCSVLALRGLQTIDVEQYLAQRFPASALPIRLAEVLQQRTAGNPLFLVNLVNDLIEQRLFVEGDGGWSFQGTLETIATQVPETSRQLITRQMDRLPLQAAQTLEAASIAGTEFSAAAVAIALEADVGEIEQRCNELVRHEEFLRRAGLSEWPDGMQATQYAFRHALYQELWHERVPMRRRQRFHLAIGDRLEQAYGNRTGEIAVELALHFEQGQDYRRAVQYLQQAAVNALRRSANQEAIAHLTKGIALLRTWPNTSERIHQELDLQITLGPTMMALKGYAAPEVEQIYARAQELCRLTDDSPQLFRALWGSRRFYFMQGTLPTARALGAQLLALAQKTQNSAFLLEANEALGATLMFQGDFVAAREHEERGIKYYDPQQHHSLAFLYGQDPGVRCLAYAAWIDWFLGYPDQARKRTAEAIALARELVHPFSLAWALACTAFLQQFLRDEQQTQTTAEEVLALAREQGFLFLHAWGDFWCGWVLAKRGENIKGLEQMHRGLEAHRAAGAEVGWPYLLALLAETNLQGGQIEEGLRWVAEALATLEKNTDRCYEPELYRIKGELLLAQSQAKQKAKGKKQKAKITNPQLLTPDPQSEAEAYFQQALSLAHQRQAKMFELRAAMSLSRLWMQQGKRDVARKMLTEIYDWFTEGFDTADLREAKTLLAELN
jgi:predicted ATPase/DNA-binding winged helix-turn-helix (wHTH) protein